MVRAKDGHRLRARAEDLVKLGDPLPEGAERAILAEVDRDDNGFDRDAIAADDDIGAIKYAVLSTARDSAHTFD
jgi:arginyl-tRNA synthetase